MRYLVKKEEDKLLPKKESGNFDNLFKEFTSPFMNEKNLDFEKSGILAKRDSAKAVFVVKNNHRNLYGGKLWNDPDVEMIANMDYMYLLPSWDWWINPWYNSKKYKVENLNHVLHKYGNTVIFVNNNKKRESEFKKIIKDEKFTIISINRQYEGNDMEFFMFYDYYRVFLPLKLAYELNRIKKNIKKINPTKLYLILRGGYLLSNFIEYPKEKMKFVIPSGFKEKIDEKYFVDDCIVMARNLKKMGAKKTSKFYLSCIDCAIPKKIYQKKYYNADIDLPSELISIFSCRIFEKNPFLIGVDYNKGKTIYHNSLVRKKFIREIKHLQKMPHLNKIIPKMAEDLFNYRKEGFKNKFFAKLKK